MLMAELTPASRPARTQVIVLGSPPPWRLLHLDGMVSSGLQSAE